MNLQKAPSSQAPTSKKTPNLQIPNPRTLPFGTLSIVISSELGIWSLSKLHYSNTPLLHFLSVRQKAAVEIVPRRLSWWELSLRHSQ
jgi:hypothetical protein